MQMSKVELTITKLEIFGLHGRSDVLIPFKTPLSIFMGPNGIGKSTILNILVHFLSRQWQRLAKQQFDECRIEFHSGDIAKITRADCAEFTPGELSLRSQEIVRQLGQEGILESVLAGDQDINLGREIADARIQARELRILRATMLQDEQSKAIFRRIHEASVIVKNNFSDRIIYLPTYRRIEQNISEILSLSPGLLRRVRTDLEEISPVNSVNYTEIVQFGMDDIQKLLIDHGDRIKEYSRQQINSLSTRYLRAALTSTSKRTYDSTFFLNLNEARIADILGRVDDAELNADQRKALLHLIKSIKERPTKGAAGRLSQSQERVASYFQMLAETHDRISHQEASMQELARILNKYISPAKNAHYDPIQYRLLIKFRDVEVPLSGLSSGEKQIVSLFSTLLIGHKEPSFVVIDEPELSLSVLWQEIILEDVMNTSTCRNLTAVTHSPFIYGAKLAKNTRDLSDFTMVREASNG